MESRWQILRKIIDDVPQVYLDRLNANDEHPVASYHTRLRLCQVPFTNPCKISMRTPSPPAIIRGAGLRPQLRV